MKPRRTPLKVTLLAASLTLLCASAAGGPGGTRERGGPSPDSLLVAQARTGRAPLGNTYLDRNNKFSIRPPAQWWLDNRDRTIAVKFSSRDHQAFIIIDTAPLPPAGTTPAEFIKLLDRQNKEVAARVPTFSFSPAVAVTVNQRAAYLSRASYRVGQNIILMDTYYVPGKTRLYMIINICPDRNKTIWSPYFNASVQSFTVLE